MAKRVLKKRRIAVLAADGFEKVELTIPVKALKLADSGRQPAIPPDRKEKTPTEQDERDQIRWIGTISALAG